MVAECEECEALGNLTVVYGRFSTLLGTFLTFYFSSPECRRKWCARKEAASCDS